MIPEREFYFIRHGQTDHNLRRVYSDGTDIALNETGREQASAVEPLIATLPIANVCHSSKLRVVETKELITPRLDAPHVEIPDLGECFGEVWHAMVALGQEASEAQEGPVHGFFQRVRSGLTQALSLPGPALIVAHGGVHWAICCLLGVEEHLWRIGNCEPVLFTPTASDWRVVKLNHP